jgi:hypothetical protein
VSSVDHIVTGFICTHMLNVIHRVAGCVCPGEVLGCVCPFATGWHVVPTDDKRAASVPHSHRHCTHPVVRQEIKCLRVVYLTVSSGDYPRKVDSHFIHYPETCTLFGQLLMVVDLCLLKHLGVLLL